MHSSTFLPAFMKSLSKHSRSSFCGIFVTMQALFMRSRMDFAVSPLCFAGEDALLDWACSPGGRLLKLFYNPSLDDRQIQMSCIRSHRQTNKEKTVAATRTEITPEPTSQCKRVLFICPNYRDYSIGYRDGVLSLSIR